MKRSTLALPGIVLAALLLGSCTSKITKPEQYSGFLSDYSRLERAESASGYPVMRWIAPGFKPENYRQVLVKSIRFYPTPEPTKQISAKTLDDLQKYLSDKVTAAFSRRYAVGPLTSAQEEAIPASQTLILRAAITGVSTGVKPLRPYEVLPIAIAAAATMTLIGERNQNTELFVEAELIDASTGQPVVQVVRKGYGKELSSRRQQLSLENLKGVIDTMVRDIDQFR